MFKFFTEKSFLTVVGLKQPSKAIGIFVKEDRKLLTKKNLQEELCETSPDYNFVLVDKDYISWENLKKGFKLLKDENVETVNSSLLCMWEVKDKILIGVFDFDGSDIGTYFVSENIPTEASNFGTHFNLSRVLKDDEVSSDLKNILTLVACKTVE